MKRFYIITILSGIILTNVFADFTPTMRYVKAAGTGDGLSWENASGDLQKMINESTEDDEIRVAAGTYTPNRKANDPDNITLGDRDNAFVLKDGVKIYGGFPADATNATTDADRDRVANETILSGDFGNNDTGNIQEGFSGMGENAHHVVIGVSLSVNTVLDGFTITGGNADGDGSIPCNGQDVFQHRGGGMVNSTSSPTLTNVTITGNMAGFGGGMYNSGSSSPILTNVAITGNVAGADGGGMYNSQSSPTLTSTVITGNTASQGGGMFNHDASTPTLTGVTIAGNTATGRGGGMYNASSSEPLLNNAILWSNQANIDPGVCNYDGYGAPNPSYSYSLIQGRDGYDDDHCIDALRVDDDDVFVDAAAGNYHLKAGSPAIDAGNDAVNSEPLDLDGKPRISGSAIDMGAYEYTRYYVKDGGDGDFSGTSWANASGDLQAMINASGAGDEIWVAGGTYYPQYTADGYDALINAYPNVPGVDPRDNAFVLKDGVKIYGGFPAGATNATTDADRDWVANETILSGDFDDNDTGNPQEGFNNMEENACHVVIGADLSANTVLDGFTITGGNADQGFGSHITCNGQAIFREHGGGISNYNSSPTLTNVVITGNTAIGGGGISNYDTSSPTLTNVVITGNMAGAGGGIYNEIYSSPMLTNVTITRNTVTSTGGGIFNYHYCSPTLTNVTIKENMAEYGGGMYSSEPSSPTLTNVVIAENTATNQGGGMYSRNYSSPTLTNVTIAWNEADNGGGMYNNSSEPQLYNTILWENRATNDGEPGVENDDDSDPSYFCCLIQGRNETADGCISAEDVGDGPLFVDVTDNCRLQAGSRAINAGENEYYQTAVEDIADKIPGYDGLLDLAGNARIAGLSIDMGAYEYGYASDPTPPNLSLGTVDRTSDTEAIIGFTTDEAGTAYYLVRNIDETGPSEEAVRETGASPGPIETGAVSGITVALTAGAKDIYVVVEDEAGNLSDTLKIAAAAYDGAPPSLSDETVDRTSDTEATIGFTTSEAGEAYYLVVNSGAAAPTTADVRAGTPLGSVEAGAVSNKAVALTAGAKDIYVVVEDAAENISPFLKIEVAAYDGVPPDLSDGTVDRTSDTEATIGFTTDEAGTAYYLVVNSGAATPTVEDVKAGTSLGSVEAGAVSDMAVALTAGAKDIYVVVEDAAENISPFLKIEAAAYVDIIPPTLSLGTVSRTSNTEATIGFTTSEAGTAYCFVVSGNSYAPSKEAVREAGTSLGSVPAGEVSNKAVVLTAGAKNIYVIVEDAAENISASLKIEAVAYIDPDATPPTLSDGTISRTSDTTAAIGFTTDAAGTAYCFVVSADSYAPSREAVREAGTSLGSVEAGAASDIAVILTAGAKNIYVVVEGEDGGLSVPLKIEAAVYVDVTPPVLSAINASDTTQAGVTLNFTTDEAGAYYYLVYADATAAPDATAIKAQGTAVAKGTGAAAEAGANTAVTVSGLTASTAYKAYIVVEDAAENLSAVAAVAFTTFPDKRIELSLPDDGDGLTVHILNAGSVETGDLTLTLSGTNADKFTLPSGTVTSLPVDGETDVTLTLSADLPNGTYTATLTVSGERLASVSQEITCTVTDTGTDRPLSKPLKAWMRGATLHVSGLTAGRTWSVYSISGALLHHDIAVDDEADVALPVRGVYVVTSGGKSIKTVY